MRVLFFVKQVDYEPQGILHLSSVLKQAGHEVKLCIVDQEDPLEATEEFSERCPERVGMPFFCNVRANLVTEELVEQLQDAGRKLPLTRVQECATMADRSRG
jgi:hypothetical protein